MPVLLLAVVAFLADLRGPFHWVHNIDPDAQYLQYGGKLADFALPGNFQHPGTTVSIIVAVAIWARWLVGGFFEGWEPLTESIVAHSNSYLVAAATLTAVLMCVLLFFAARSVYRLTGSLVTAIAVQVSPLLLTGLVENLWGVRPEVVEIVVGLGLLIVIAPVILGKNTQRMARKPGLAYAAGCMIACGVATKFNFVSLVSLVLVFPGIKQKLRAAAAFAGSLTLLLVPIMLEHERFRSWLEGRVNRGNVVAISDTDMLASMWSNIVLVFRSEPSLGWFLALYISVGLAILVSLGLKPGDEGVVLGRTLWVGVLAIVGHLILTSTNYQQRYLMPALIVPLLMNPVVVRAISVVPFGKFVRIGLAAGALVAGVSAAWEVNAWFGHYKRGLEVNGDHAEALRKKREERKECLVVGYYRSSVPTFGLFFGREYAGSHFTNALEKAYPGAVHYRRFMSDFRDWSLRSASQRMERHVSEGGCVLLQGSPIDGHWLFGWQVRPVLMPPHRGREALYELSLDSLNPVLLSVEDAPAGAVVLEAEEFLRGNVGSRSDGSVTVVESADTPAFAEYEWEVRSEHRVAIRIRYASAESHPLKVYLNGELIMESACHVPTGGDEPSDQKWHDLGMYGLEKGENLLRLETDGEFPSVDKIAVKRVPG